MGNYNTEKRKRQRKAQRARQHSVVATNDTDTEPDWSSGCENCGERPIVPATGMCGPCTFGEADTVGGNW